MASALAPIPELLAQRYRVLHELGRGSMGTVYACEEIDGGRHVAVKRVPLRGSDDLVRARVAREQHALSRLSSPHIVQLLDVVEEGEALHLVYELVEGRSLDGIHKLPVDAALSVATAVATALAEAHRKGFIHRDIKPSNVIVPYAADGALELEAAKVLDFGIAGALTRRSHGMHTTAIGEVFGSPLYMSPEQIRGEAQSAAADVYGVGALLFELVYGRTVFQGAAFIDLLQQIASAQVEFPETPPIPAALRALIERCLAKDPRARFAHGSELLDALVRVTRETLSGPVLRAPASMAMDWRDMPLGPSPQRPQSAAPTASARVPELRVHPRSRRPWLLAAAISVSVASVAWLGIASTSRNTIPVSGALLLALAGIAASWLAAYLVHRAIERRRVPLAGTLVAVLGRAQAVEDLSKSLALDVEQLLEACRSLDQHMLAKTLALMVGEYDQARESEDRQAALMKAVELMEKLHHKLAPWYVKRQTALTWAVGLLGSAFSGAKTLGEIFEALHKH